MKDRPNKRRRRVLEQQAYARDFFIKHPEEEIDPAKWEAYKAAHPDMTLKNITLLKGMRTTLRFARVLPW